MQTHIDTRERFFDLLHSHMSGPDFRTKVSILLDKDPYFIPGYLEHIWYTGKNESPLLRQAILGHTVKIVEKIYNDQHIQKQLKKEWTSYERQALVDLLKLQRELRPSFFHAIKNNFRLLTINKTFKVTQFPNSYGKHLRLIKTIDPTDLIDELKRPPYWWNIDARRISEPQSHHFHTHALYLRQRPEFNSGDKTYKPIDRVHESFPCEHSKLFPKIHNAVLTFAKEHKLALGRVSIVRLKPHSQIYRHYDYEEHLHNRNRYHLSIQGNDLCTISAGPEVVSPKPGEFWFFDNKVMHRAENKSDSDRVTVIFDGYKLK